MSQFTELRATQLSSILPIQASVSSTHVATATLQVRENPANGSVLTSDEDGNATWQSPSIDPSSTLFVRGLGLTSDTLNTTILSTPATQTVDYTITLPEVAPATGQVLQTINTDGDMVWVDGVATTTQIVVVSPTPASGQFNSIAAAIASITDAAEDKRYLVLVQPGRYIEEGLVLPEYVTVSGTNVCSVQIVPPVPSLLDVFTLQDNTCLANIEINGTTDTGLAAVAVVSAGTSFVFRVHTEFTDIGIRMNLSGGASHTCTTQMVLMDRHITNFINIVADVSSIAVLNMSQTYNINTPTGTTPLVISLDGAGTDLILSGGNMSRELDAVPFGVFSRQVNGARLIASGIEVDGYVTIFDVPADTGNPELLVDSVESKDSTTLINVLNTNTTGHLFSNIEQRNRINIVQSSSFTISNRDNNKVTVAKKGADFTSVAEAIAYVTAQSPTAVNSWTVEIGTGTFTENNPIMVPAFVSITGVSTLNTNIAAADPTQPVLIILEGSVTLDNLSITGANTGGSGVLYNGSAVGNTFYVNNVDVYDCTTGYDMTNQAGFCIIVIRHISMGALGEFTSAQRYGIRVRQISTLYPVIVALNTCTGLIPSTALPTLANPFTAFSFEGTSGAAVMLVSMANITMSQVASSSGSTLVACDNARMAIVALFGQNYDTLIHLTASTLPVVLTLQNMTNTTAATVLLNENNNTSGTIGGVFDASQIDNTAAPLSTITYLIHNGTTGGLSVTGSLNIGETLDTLVDYIPGLNANVATGVITGGELTLTGGLGFSVSAGTGYITSGSTSDPLIYLEWGVLTGSTSANSDIYVSVVDGPVLSLTASVPDPYTSIIIGSIRSNATSIIYQQDIARQGLHTVTLLDNTMRDAFGAIVSAGIIGSAGTAAFQISVTSGRYYYSTQQYNPSGGTDVTFTEFFHVAGVFTPNTPTNQLTAVDARRWDDGTNLVALAVGEWVKHVIYIVNDGVSEYYAFVYGQTAFASQSAAENGALPLPPIFINENFATVSAFVLGDASVDWVTVQDVRPTLQFTAAGVTVSTDHGSLSGLLDDDHPQYLLVDGTRAMSGNLNMGSQNIANVGTINSVDITDLSPRLIPGGADALPTAVVETIGILNSEGSATSFARSDHVHAHGVQTETTLHALATAALNGFMPSTDKSKLDSSTALSTASTLMERDSSGGVAVGQLTIEAGTLRLGNTTGTFFTSVRALPALITNYTLTLPPNDGNAGEFLQTNGSGVLSWVAGGGGGSSVESYVLRDSKTIGTNGGTAIAGLWFVRTLNSMTSVGGANVGLAANQFTLQPGSWQINATVPGHRVDGFQARVYDINNAAVLVVGSSEDAKNNNRSATIRSVIQFTWTIGVPTTYQIEQRVGSNRTIDGLGVAANFGTEVYTLVTINKI